MIIGFKFQSDFINRLIVIKNDLDIKLGFTN